MALVHENLYQSSNLAEISVREYILSLTNNLFSSYHIDRKHIALKVESGDISMNPDTLIPCGLIINELVTNSLKHAFKDARKGEISIEIREGERGMFTLVVQDDGIGIPEDINGPDDGSLGFKIVYALADQLDGNIEIDRTSGTRFVIKIKQDTEKSWI